MEYKDLPIWLLVLTIGNTILIILLSIANPDTEIFDRQDIQLPPNPTLIDIQEQLNIIEDKLIYFQINNTIKVINNTVPKQNFACNHTCNCEITTFANCPEVVRPAFAEIIKMPKNAGNYDRGEYDCSDMTEILVEQLIQIGFNAKYTSCKLNNQNHAIVKIEEPIYIESISGRIILPEDYSKYGLPIKKRQSN